MNRKELRLINVILVVLVVVAGLFTLKLSVNGSVASLARSLFSRPRGNVQSQVTQQERACPSKPALSLGGFASDPHIKMLDQYQQVCGGFVTNQLMIFTNFPSDPATVQADSAKMAARLKLLSTADITPIVIAEPYVGDSAMSYKEFLQGKYDAALAAYFDGLKKAGVTDEMMGMWVPFPETNTPNWNNKDTEPRDFALGVNRYLGALKQRFPRAKGSVLLNATTYAPDDLEYANGDYLDLEPYLRDLDKKLVTSIGIQGFPWVSNATTARREIFKASEFLQPELAISAARELRTRDIWFNTGTFAAKYTNDRQKRAVISANERKAILHDILEVARTVQNYQQNEYRVSINLFSQDKSAFAEATDWSYLQSEDHKMIFREFVAKAAELQLPIALFDRAE